MVEPYRTKDNNNGKAKSKSKDKPKSREEQEEEKREQQRQAEKKRIDAISKTITSLEDWQTNFKDIKSYMQP